MAITEVTELGFVSGSFTEELRSYSVAYQVKTSSASDGPRIVKQHPTFRIGKEYSFGGESDALAKLRSVEPTLKQAEGQRRLWRVLCVFETSAIENASDFKSTWEIMPVPYTKTARGTFMKSVTRKAGKETIVTTRLGDKIEGDGYEGPILNSAFLPLEPQPEELAYNLVLRRRMLMVNGIKKAFVDAVGAINEDDFNVLAGKGTKTFTYRFPKYTLKVNNFIPEPIEDLQELVTATWELEFNPDTWLAEYEDKGRASVAELVVEDSGSSSVSDTWRIVVDDRGAPIVDPVLFNGKGGPLANPSDTPVRNVWLTKKTVKFSDLDII